MYERVILHSDCNCFYASVEHLHHPELSGKPIAVGGNPKSRHGIILTADYIAKKRGVKAGMALWEAERLCPEITFLAPRMDLYLRFSRMAHEIYADYTDRQEPFGVDESWLDVSENVSLQGDGLKIAEKISARVKSELGITVSIGVSFNKIFAKLGSDYKKPDGITTIYKNEYMTKVWRLPVSDLLYVGNSTAAKFRTMGINTIGDLARTDVKLLESRFGKIGPILWSFANGYDDTPVNTESDYAPIKSIGNSTTTHRDLVCIQDVKVVVYMLAESVGKRLRENGFKCRTVEVWMRNNDLESFTRQKQLKNATAITEEIAQAALELFKDNYDFTSPLRSIGVRGCELVNANYWEQLDLFTDSERRRRQFMADCAVDDIRNRFGYFSVQRGVEYLDSGLSHLDASNTHAGYPGRSYL